MVRCRACRGFITRAIGWCPNCGAKAFGVLGAIAGGACAVTLMACYGVPCVGSECDFGCGHVGDGGDGSTRWSACPDANAIDAKIDVGLRADSSDASGDARETDAAADADAADTSVADAADQDGG